MNSPRKITPLDLLRQVKQLLDLEIGETSVPEFGKSNFDKIVANGYVRTAINCLEFDEEKKKGTK